MEDLRFPLFYGLESPSVCRQETIVSACKHGGRQDDMVLKKHIIASGERRKPPPENYLKRKLSRMTRKSIDTSLQFEI